MIKGLQLCMVLLFISSAQAQGLNKMTTLRIGATKVNLSTTCFPPCSSQVLFLNLHGNERTSVKAASGFLATIGGTIVCIQHPRQRNITFKLNNTTYIVDPNRIFTTQGIRASMSKLSSYNKKAARAVHSFAEAILKLVNAANLVVALHNNTNGDFSILSYAKGHSQSRNAALVYINPKMDADDFVFTTKLSIFHQLKIKKINVVLQNNQHVVNDGSLSVYEGSKKKAYMNIEAQQGHYNQQLKMLRAVKEIIVSYTKD